MGDPVGLLCGGYACILASAVHAFWHRNNQRAHACERDRVCNCTVGNPESEGSAFKSETRPWPAITIFLFSVWCFSVCACSLSLDSVYSPVGIRAPHRSLPRATAVNLLLLSSLFSLSPPPSGLVQPYISPPFILHT